MCHLYLSSFHNLGKIEEISFQNLHFWPKIRILGQFWLKFTWYTLSPFVTINLPWQICHESICLCHDKSWQIPCLINKGHRIFYKRWNLSKMRSSSIYIHSHFSFVIWLLTYRWSLNTTNHDASELFIIRTRNTANIFRRETFINLCTSYSSAVLLLLKRSTCSENWIIMK